MYRRKFFFSAAAAAIGITRAARAWELAFPAGESPSTADGLLAGTESAGPDVMNTHAALFDMWFPLKQLDIPPPIVPEIQAIAAQVEQGMFAEFAGSSLLPLIQGMTVPQLLPFVDALKSSANPAVQAFLAAPGGFAGMPEALRLSLFSFLFDGSAGPQSTQLAMVLREAYLSGIWDLPLAVPLCDITAPASLWIIPSNGRRSTRQNNRPAV